MTPAKIYVAVRDILIIAAIGFIFYRVYTDGKNAVHAQQLTDLQHQIQEQGKQAATWHKEATDANGQLAADIRSINSAPVVVHDWLPASASCPKQQVLPPTPAAASGTAASGGGDQPVSRAAAGESAMRDAILDDWKKSWEKRLAGWRAENAQWPTP